MPASSLKDTWKDFLLRAAQPWPVLTTLVLVGAGSFATWESNHARLNIPAPPPYEEHCGPNGAPVSNSGASYCSELAEMAQRHSFTLQWVGWALVFAGGLFGIAMALKEDSPDQPQRLFSPKNRAVFLVAVGGAISALGAQITTRSSDAAHAAAEATHILAELVLIKGEQTPEVASDADDAGLRDAGTTPEAGASAHEAGVASAAAPPSPPAAHKAAPASRCVQKPTPDRLAFHSCVEVKSHWLSGRTSTSIIDDWRSATKNGGSSMPAVEPRP